MAEPPVVPPPRGPSALDAAQQAVGHTGRHLLPFRFERWLTLGFLAFLDQCGRQAAHSGLNFRTPGGWSTEGGEATRAIEWLAAHAALVAVLSAIVLAFVVALMAVVLYVNSRGVFMYLDAVATGRAEVGRPWREHAGRAGSYFAWSFGLALAGLMATLFTVLAILGLLAAGLRSGGPRLSVIVAVVALVLALIASLLMTALAGLALRDFVAPLQLASGQPCSGAIRVFLGLVAAHPGAFVLYLLLKLAFSFVLGMAMLLAACLTCCCAALPVVAQTLFQPAFFFERAWSLYLLRDMGYDVLGGYAVPALAGGRGLQEGST